MLAGKSVTGIRHLNIHTFINRRAIQSYWFAFKFCCLNSLKYLKCIFSGTSILLTPVQFHAVTCLNILQNHGPTNMDL